MLLKFVYSLFIGLLFVTFVGFGIDAFYQSPKPPQTKPIIGPQSVKQQQEQQQKEQKVYDAFQQKINIYNRDVSVICFVIAILALIASLYFFREIQIMLDGFLLGGIFTLVYGIFRAISSQDAMFRFVMVAIAFVITLGVGYRQFIKPQKKKK